jgi:hypothetical protein
LFIISQESGLSHLPSKKINLLELIMVNSQKIAELTSRIFRNLNLREPMKKSCFTCNHIMNILKPKCW